MTEYCFNCFALPINRNGERRKMKRFAPEIAIALLLIIIVANMPNFELVGSDRETGTINSQISENYEPQETKAVLASSGDEWLMFHHDIKIILKQKIR
jgi:ABC-type cobalt transport system substrate-binding protein